jgi:hypothetical protein
LSPSALDRGDADIQRRSELVFNLDWISSEYKDTKFDMTTHPDAIRESYYDDFRKLLNATRDYAKREFR